MKKRSLGFWMCTALVVGNMIGSGVFLLPSSLAPFGGISLLGWLFTSAGAILLALVYARLSKILPKAGGHYAYTREGFGEFAGFLVAWGYWISILAANAAIAVAFVGYLGVFWPLAANNNIAAVITALAVIWLLTGLNCAGVRNAGLFQLVTFILKLVPLIVIGSLGLFYFNPDNFTPLNLSGQSGFSAITATAALTLWAFLGLESASVPADEIIEPEKTIARATVFGTILTAVIYIISTTSVMGVLSPATLAKSTAPFSDTAKSLWGAWAGYAIAVGAAISCLGALNGWILLAGQVPLATAKGGLFPRIFAKVSANGTPTAGLIISGIFVTILMSMNYTKGLVSLFTFVILLATLTCLLPYAFTALAELMLVMKDREKISGKLTGPVILSILAFSYSLWAVAGSGETTVYWGFLLVLAGFPVYIWVKWQGAK